MRIVIHTLMLLVASLLSARADETGLIEPHAGAWKPWVIASAAQLRVPPPPDQTATAKEQEELSQVATTRDHAALDRVAYWDTGSPSYRWSEIAVAEHLKIGTTWQIAARDLALMHIAIYDAMVAAWDSKYAYKRPRPSAVSASLATAIPNPPSPSYPAEHAVAAGAASEVLAYIFPARADYFRELAKEAARSRLVAGVNYPSDIAAGMTLGKEIAALVIARGKSDGTDAKWTGSVPTGPGKWTGINPVLPLNGTWKPWVLSRPDEFRPGPPLPYDSPEKAAEQAELKNFPRTPQTNNEAMFWEAAVGGLRAYQYWNEQLSKKTLEYRLDDNPPRAARAFVLPFVTLYDVSIACWDAKYAYWAIRPFQLDSDVKPVFATPNHPSYPAAHACASISITRVLGYLFPRDAQALAALGERAAESRIWAGIHYRSDIVAGRELAIAVANKVIARAKEDGAD
ncbi:vanadium-dependent haloperoxidase [Bradyrhizobium sp. CCGUVB23]|uniref:vanadium-dependent haloperoxidase n=1 Tax=Bradyrhizobium sp. CCGUVB23 TaxID=2949630 RepID=UPI0020B340C2|nr:vanadium-dependent haloperoxidase [Bradyrhizobium sp. CCGUVB23]MCP3462941.1 vanadium-dependent haloperoxidase [Bradyrhizobium sp. CCGUVB23]